MNELAPLLLALFCSSVALAQAGGDASGGAEAGPAVPDSSSVRDAGVEPAPRVEQSAPLPASSPAADAESVDESDAPQALPKGFTGVYGTVADSKSNEGLIEATVKVVSGLKKQALTDVDGHYRLKLPPGTYELRVFYELYEGRRIGNVVVKPGEATRLDVGLSSDSRAVQEVVVEAHTDKRNESALLQERKKAAVVSDSVGAQEIARTPDSSAGDAVKRVVSATIVDGRYVFLRGLGGRYAQTLLNGTLLPSPEPDEPSVPLDLFPAALLSNLNVVKTYSPDLPATFGGGSLTLDTNTFPTAFEIALRFQLAGDSETTFRPRKADTTSVGENFGFRDGSRDLPAAVPVDRPVSPRSDEPTVTAAQQRAAGQSFHSTWLPTLVTSLPAGSFGVQIGDTIKLGGEKRLGYLVGAQISRRERRTVTQTLSTSGNEQTLEPREPGTAEFGSLSGSTSVLANVGLQLNRDNEINYLGLYLANAEATASRTMAYDDQTPINFTADRLQFTQRQLFFNQLKGFHRLNVLNDAEIDWQGNFTQVNRLEPEIRDIRYDQQPGIGDVIRTDQPNSAQRFYTDLTEDSGGGTLNLTIPWRRARFKIGGLGQYSARSFEGRRLRLVGAAPEQLRAGSPDTLLSADHVGPPTGDGAYFTLKEETFNTDSYTASLSVYGGYALVDWRITDWFRAMGGVRYEGSTQSINSGSIFASFFTATNTTHVYNDAVPGVNLVFSPTAAVNLRASYAYTLARPTFRELGPFLFFDVVRRRNVSGNPDLRETHIHHADVRAEWFPSDNEVLAATGFAKVFQDPIERVVVASSSENGLGFRNAEGATLLGAELEARAGLKHLAPVLSPFRVGANFSLIYSRIQLGPDAAIQTNPARPLQGQSPYVGNVFIQWEQLDWGTEAGVYYNVYGPRISEVGTNGKPDVYEQPFHRLDVTLSQRLGAGFKLKLSASNLLNQAVHMTQGQYEVFRIQTGVQFFANVSWSYSSERK